MPPFQISAKLFYMLIAFLVSDAKIYAADIYKPCAEDEVKYQERSNEIQKIVDSDQKDRTSNSVAPGAPQRDRERRMRIGEIFGEGCFRSAKDYANAALVFQHGDQPDHFLQTFIWAKKSVELGDESQKRMMALAMDRYLVNIGHKQLFASQAYKDNKQPCWCLQMVEVTFPEKLREGYMGASLKVQEDWVDKMNEGKECQKKNYCKEALKNTPKGFVPGFW